MRAVWLILGGVRLRLRVSLVICVVSMAVIGVMIVVGLGLMMVVRLSL